MKGEYALITGGCGFVGANLSHRLLSAGERVMLYDNLCRPGVERNYEWLRSRFSSRVTLCRADTRDAGRLREAAGGASSVFHFAAQVAVTTSLADPAQDFEVNAWGTLNLLEALRRRREPPPLLFTSTNKVYGALAGLRLRRREERYEPCDEKIRQCGVDEGMPLDFYSPYGCSKGTADQYVLEYARTCGIPAVVFRMSCIYGPRQFGTEDQGWLAHFLIRALEKKPVTLFGDGRQVRDVLFIDDLVDAFLLAREKAHALAGCAFNMGGGPRNTVSLLEVIARMTPLTGESPRIVHGDWRSGDQRYYVSNTARFSAATGWEARTGVKSGMERLLEWLLETRAQNALPAR